MVMWLGDYNEDDTVYFIWSTNDSNGASITRATDGTVSVYKNNGTSQSTAGVTDTEDFDSLTGIHACTIDLSADAFYATGSDYAVVLSAATIDGQTVNAVLAHFSIENRSNVKTSDLNSLSLMQSTTIATLASQTSFTLTAGSADDNAYNGSTLICTDQSTATQKCKGIISDYTGASKTVTLKSDPGIFTMAVGDTVDILSSSSYSPAVDLAESTLTYDDLLRICLAALAEKSAGGGTATVTFRDHADGKDRITATVDSNGNRTAVTLDGS